MIVELEQTTGTDVCQLHYSDFPGINFTVASSGEGLQQ